MSIALDPLYPEDDPLRLVVVRDRWTRPEPGTMEIDPHAGIIRIWLREGEYVIPRGAITVEDMTLITEMARRGALGPPAVPLRNGNTFQVAAGAVTASVA